MSNRLETECSTVLEQVQKEHRGFQEVNWMLRQIARHCQADRLKRERPGLVIVGEDFPPELALSICDHPRYILGGSLETTHWSDSLLPRDADPITRSACGWLLNEYFQLAENAVVILTMTNDNRRKMAGLLRRHGLSVISVDMPPHLNTLRGNETWADEMLRAAQEAASQLGVHLTWAICWVCPTVFRW